MAKQEYTEGVTTLREVGQALRVMMQGPVDPSTGKPVSVAQSLRLLQEGELVAVRRDELTALAGVVRGLVLRFDRLAPEASR